MSREETTEFTNFPCYRFHMRNFHENCYFVFSSSGLVNHNLNSISSQLPVIESQITEIKLNEDGKLLYAATGDKVKIWDLRKLV